MATFKLTTASGKVHTFKARSWSDANGQAHYICKRDNDSRYSMETIKVVKAELPAAVIAGHEMVRDMMMANPEVNKAMDLVESSYIKYWQDRRDEWFNFEQTRTSKEIEQWFFDKYGQTRSGDFGRDYYGSQYYKLKNSGALSSSPQVYQRWLDHIKKEALAAKDQSINNMIHAIVKIAKGEVITTFKVIEISKGKDGLDGIIKVNNTIKRVYAIYAQGPIQCLHIRYLIK